MRLNSVGWVRVPLLLAGLLLAQCACADATQPYTLGVGDSIEVKVGGEADLSGVFRISGEGTIIYPLLGAVEVVGASVGQVARTLRDRLADGYLVSPQVAVYVSECASKRVMVLGDVPAPGFYFLKANSSLLSLLTDAGFLISNPNVSIVITHAEAAKSNGVPETPAVVDLGKVLNPWGEDPTLLPRDGDRIFVRSKEGGRIVVSGRVKTPGVIPLGAGITVLEAINQAGGMAEFSNPKGVRVLRETPDGSQVMKVDLAVVMDGDRSQDIALQDGDIVIVPRRWF